MNIRTKSLLKNIGILTISNFASKILIFLMVPLYTNILSTTEYGTYDLAISTVNLFYPILTLNIIDSIMLFLMDKTKSKTNVITIALKYVVYSVIIAASFLLIINRLQIWEEIFGLEIYIFLYYLFCVFNQYFIQVAKGLDKVYDLGIAGIIGTIIMIAANLLFLLVFKWGLIGFFIASIFSQAIPVFYFIIRLRYWNLIGSFHTDKMLIKEMLVYCMPLIATTIGWWINSGSDKYVVTFFCGVATNGILSVAYKIPSILNTLQGIFVQAWQISAVKEYGKKDTAIFYGNTFLIINILMCAACSWLILLTKPLAHILYAKDFFVAWQFVPFLLISSVINCASGFLGPILAAKRDSKSMAMSAVYGASGNLILNIVFVYFIGAQGVTIATIIASFVIYLVRKKAIGHDIAIKNYKNVIITWVLLCIQGIIEIYTTYWYVEIFIMIILAAINSEGIKNILNKLKNY